MSYKEKRNLLKAGAGISRIKIPEKIFPHENYVAEEDPIHVRVLLLEHSEKTVIVSLELPSVRNENVLKRLKKQTAEITGAREPSVWICTTHNLSTMHIPPEDVMPEKFQLFVSALENALRDACRIAVDHLEYSKMGVAFGTCDINTNRDIESNQGWWNGLNGIGVQDKMLTVFRFENHSGEPIAVLYHYPLKSCSVSGASYPDGTKHSTFEISGESSAFVEKEIGAPAIFFMGAAADMVPGKCAVYCEVDQNGDLRDVNLGIEEGFKIKRELGTKLGSAVCDIARKITCKEEVFICQKQRSFWYKGQKFYNEGRPYHPTPAYKYIPAEDEELKVQVLCLENTVLFGMMPETTAIIGIMLRNRTSPVVSLAVALVDGGKDYMADRQSYDRFTFSGTHSVFARGSAEQFIEDAAKIVQEIYAES